jgi:predicted DNA-binding protein (MmcQ/YjbR family)
MGQSRNARLLKRLRTLCLALPETKEIEAWGHATFRAGKPMFAVLHGKPADPALALIVGHDRQDELLRDPRFFPTPYSAHHGWVSLRLDEPIDWDEIAALLREAYRKVALKRMLAALDGKT